MLEIRNLVKIYTTKGGEPVRAIDGVSARFRETGMVFLLGKSGSGKSTLLNMCGGLDTPDEGEIIIKGRSSKDFSPSDFDSYRNTYVGFIFQEYNILEEFTVADNIALALELQGKNKAQDAVERILEEVDLAGYGSRKPNTLSGGQRQRVAIARALVKDPEIIMADEPTGALDSETGKQVLDTLKKLSRTKLVLVVTHDREFAEMYGDRIIELKDGKIISDVTRTEQGATEENIRFTDDVIAIRSGAQLTARDLEKINAFLARREEPIVITAEKQSVERVLCDACLEEGSAAFSGTDETRIAAKTYTEEESRFIRSRLPLSRAIRIGASSMRVKPVRLAFTIFLSVLSFIMFGLFSTLTFFDRAETSLRTYRDLGYEMLSLINNYQYRNTSYVDGKESESWAESRTTLFTTDDYEALRDQFGPDTIGIYNYGSIGSTRKFVPENVRSPASYSARYYYAGISGLAAVDPASQYWTGKLLTDTDLSALGPDDIVISSYTFDSICHFGLYSDGRFSRQIPLSTYDDIVGKPLFYPSESGEDVLLTVRGVYRSDFPAEFDLLKDPPAIATPQSESLQQRFILELKYGLYDIGLVCNDFYDAHLADFFNPNFLLPPEYTFVRLGESYPILGSSADPDDSFGYCNQAFGYPPSHGDLPTLISRFDGKPCDTPLAHGETIVPYDVIEQQLRPIIETLYEEMLLQANGDPVQKEAADAWLEAIRTQSEILRLGNEYDYDVTEADISAALTTFYSLLEQLNDDPDLAYDPNIVIPTQPDETPFTIVGFYYGSMNANESGLYFSPDDFQALYRQSYADKDEEAAYVVQSTNYVLPENARFQHIAVPIPGNNRALRALLHDEGVIDSQNDTFYTVDSIVAYQINAVTETIRLLEYIFLLIGVVMAVFSMLLLFNFISVSISNKKKEIGILRAVGARGMDVFKIFFSEAALIGLICYVLSVIVCFVLCDVLNRLVATTLPVAIFIFGPLSWLVMLAIAALTSFLATLLPVRSAAKRKPVESIRAL